MHTGRNQDTSSMAAALLQAQRAAKKGEVPIGAVVITEEGVVIGKGYNRVEGLRSQLEHAEVRALRAASQKLGTWRLSGCTLYVTLEPCAMCMALAGLSRIERVVYGADSPKFGYRIQEEAALHLDKGGSLALYSKLVRGVDRGQVSSGILAEESAQLLQDFFSQKRRSR